MFSWLMAKIYDYMIRDAEEKCLQNWRKQLLQNISGDVLEIGCGTGANLALYPTTVKHLTLLEPNIHMQKQLEKKLSSYSNLSVNILNCPAESISLPDNSVDVVISTLVLCSVNDLDKSLSEIHRVLKPEGKLIVIEHVAANNRPERLKWQRRIEPIWKLLQCNCHLTRDTEKNIKQAGFEFIEIKRESIRGVPPIARPSIRGVAKKQMA